MIQCDACLYKNIQTLEVDAPCRSPVYPSSYEPLEGTQKYPIICLKTANTACQLQSFKYEENTSDQIRRCPMLIVVGVLAVKQRLILVWMDFIIFYILTIVIIIIIYLGK